MRTNSSLCLNLGTIDPHQSFCKGLGVAVAFEKQRSQFTIVTRDRFGNCCEKGGELFFVKLESTEDRSSLPSESKVPAISLQTFSFRSSLMCHKSMLYVRL